MKIVKNLLAFISVVGLIGFLIYSTVIASQPKDLLLQGQVEAKQVKVASKLIGRIDSLAVRKGQKVKKGDLLFRLNSPEVEAKLVQALAGRKAAVAQNNKAKNGARYEDIEAAYNSYQKAVAAADLLEKTFLRVDNLYKDGVVPAQKRDEAQTKKIAAENTEKAAKALWNKATNGARSEDKAAASAIVNQADGVILELESYLQERNIFSPIDGEIANLISEEGELVPSGFPVITVVDLNDIWFSFNIREDLLAKMHLGKIVKGKVPALGDKEYDLEITSISVLGSYAIWNSTKTSGDFDMKTFEVIATPVEKIEHLRPGMSVLVDWTLMQ